MKKFGAHRLYLSAREAVQGPVVVQLDDEGLFVSYERLTAEQPAVEWLGGIFLLLPVSEHPDAGMSGFGEWYESVSPVYHFGCPYALWHVSGLPADAPLQSIPNTAPHRLG